jgi:glucans biosynthesis protein
MPSVHRRNTAPMRASPRCGAKTRTGKACRAPAVRHKQRCRMHGGAYGSGAPCGNQNALKHGTYGRAARARRAAIRALLLQAEECLKRAQPALPLKESEND